MPTGARSRAKQKSRKRAGGPKRLGTSIGSRIFSLRTEHDLTQATLAASCGLTPQMIWRYEHNVAEPSAETIGRLARALEVDEAFLTHGPSSEPHGSAA